MRSKIVLCLLLLVILVATASAHGQRTDGIRPVSADPVLLETLGAKAVARIAGNGLPEAELYEVHRSEKAGGFEKITGTGTCLLLLVDWADHPADAVAHPASDFDDMMFSTGVWPTGSMNDFYLENSLGQFGVAGAADGWHTSSVPYANVTPTDYYQVRDMFAAIITEFDPVIDYSQYDNDGPDGVPDSGDDDGLIDSLFFVHAGPGRESTGDDNDIWSHAWSFGGGGVATADGVSAYRYSVEPEEFSDETLMTVGVFCHEYAHVLGLPDLYDTDYSSSGIGDWGLMSGGSWGRAPGGVAGSSPSHLTAWSKMQLGWLTPTVITADQLGVLIPPAETHGVAYRIFRGGATSGDEYFLVENRQPIGFDQTLTRRQVDYGLPQAAGLVIYHVDDALSGNSNERHRLVDVVEASPWFHSPTDWIEHLDGPRDYSLQLWLNNYNRGDNGDAWPGWSVASIDSTDWVGPRDRNRFADDTIPPAHDYICDPTGIAIENITVVGQDVTADFVIGAKNASTVSPDKVLSWTFETDTDGWQFCNGYVHRDTDQSGSCSGTGGLWFGTDDAEYTCPPGYGNNWYDFTWRTVGVSAGATVSLRHHYDLENSYDYAWVEVRCAGDSEAPWHTVASFTGSNACVTDTWAIPAAAITACANPSGYAVLDLRLRMTSDGGWSAEDGNFCGVGWWIDEVTITGEYVTAADDLPIAARAELLPAVPNPFNPSTTLKYNVPVGARDVKLTVFDQRGRSVRTFDVGLEPGWAEMRWDGRDDDGRALSSGVYFARLAIDGAVLTEKMALLK